MISVALIALAVLAAGRLPLSPATATWHPAPRVAAPVTAVVHDWRPVAGQRWQWQTGGGPDLAVPADVFVLDGLAVTRQHVEQLHTQGRRAICSFEAGTVRADRPDAARFPTAATGKSAPGATGASGPGERWLDIRRWGELMPVLADRLRTCRDKGFDAVAPGRLDGYAHATGFPLTAEDQLTFDERLVAAAHAEGLDIAYTGGAAQVGQVTSGFDLAIVEGCFASGTCARWQRFTDSGRAVFDVEYEGPVASFCPAARSLGISAVLKHRDLTDAWQQHC